MFAGVLCDGVDDFISYGDVTTFDGATSLSIYVRLKFDTRAVNDRIIHKWGGDASERAFVLQLDSGADDELRFAVGNGSGNIYIRDTTNANLANSTEYRIVATWNTSSGMTVYVNGSSKSLASILSGSVASIPNVTTVYGLCEEIDDLVDGIDGNIYEYAVWDVVLTQADVDRLESGVMRMFHQVQPSNLLSCSSLGFEPDGDSADGVTYTDECDSSLTATASDSVNNTGMLGVAEDSYSYP